jgi:hypothetical protein
MIITPRVATYAIERVAVIGPDGRWLPLAEDHYRPKQPSRKPSFVRRSAAQRQPGMMLSQICFAVDPATGRVSPLPFSLPADGLAW